MCRIPLPAGRGEADPAVRVILVTGQRRALSASVGDSQALEAFEIGAYDAGTRTDLVTPATHPYRALCEELFALSFRHVKPSQFTAISTAAAGLGGGLVAPPCYADIRFAWPGASSQPRTARSHLPAENRLSWLLPRLIGGARAAGTCLASHAAV